MMRRLLFCLTAALLLSSCAVVKREPLPKLVRASGATQPLQQCAALFPEGRWQLVHAIAFRMADGTSGNALGALVLNDLEIKCALMTVEGLTLFEARSADEEDLEVLRALPPFDNREFAAGLMRDVRTLFRLPPGAAQYGTLTDGTPVCRYAYGHAVTDILPQEDGCWRMHTYGEQLSIRTDGCWPAEPAREQLRTRTIKAQSCSPVASAIFPHSLELIGSGPAGYSLNMRLISAERLPVP
ncbi:MAG: hypothetical protein JZU50_13170 [Desulfobulbaceae bacterium]|nr:hypothetical protein [Desulfobulbaceae bacterium]